MKLTHEEVKKIARLARLQLTEADLEKYATQLSAVLSYIERLNQLDTANIEPTAHAFLVPTPFREDKVKPYTEQELSLQNAPDREGPFFKVPKVIA